VAKVSDVQWPRLYACVWADSTKTLQTAFEGAPKKAIDPLRTKFGIGPDDTLLDLNSSYDPVATWLSDPKRIRKDLEDTITNGSPQTGPQVGQQLPFPMVRCICYPKVPRAQPQYRWRTGPGYMRISGFRRQLTLTHIAEHYLKSIRPSALNKS
jgi:hypothetical protein